MQALKLWRQWLQELKIRRILLKGIRENIVKGEILYVWYYFFVTMNTQKMYTLNIIKGY